MEITVSKTLKQAPIDLNQVVRQANAEGPQAIRDGAGGEAVVLSRDDYRALRRSNASGDLVAFFETWPSLADLDLRRDRDGDSERAW